MSAKILPLAHQFKLAHILSMDLYGKSGVVPLSSSDSQRLQNFVRGTREFQKAAAGRKVVVAERKGGVTLVFFSDVEAPLRCALEMSQIAILKTSLPLRMGLHSGTVNPEGAANADGKLSGEGIQVAERVMKVGDSGHVLISDSAADLLRPLSRWNDSMHDLGEFEIRPGSFIHLFNFWNQHIGNAANPKILLVPGPADPRGRHDNSVVGTMISHYRILRKLGSGGMGVVYEAADSRLGRHVAVKLLPEQYSSKAAAIERFRREACTASTLNHPNICTVHDVGQHEGQHFIVMELLEGRNLKQEIASGPLSSERIVTIGVQIAEGLQAAHARNIVHRDIKPANLFLTNGDRVKIVDFGLAKLTGRNRLSPDNHDTLFNEAPTEQNITRSEEFVGTVAYMSPEQARGELLDNRSDLFSFGIVLYEMATGTPPFRGDTSAVVFDSILNRPPTSPVHINPNVSPEMERIITRALEKRRGLRYQSAADMAADLNRLSADDRPLVPAPMPPVSATISALQVVLLYKRNAQPDEQLMRLIEEGLLRQGHQVFVDRNLAIGVEWAREIENKIGSADAIIPLLSAASVQSEMLAYEVQLANSFAERQGGKPRILPVRLQFQAPLPDALHSVLHGLNYSLWQGASDNEKVFNDLARSLQTPEDTFRRKPSLEPVGGALPIDSKFYIVRPTDQDFFSAVARQDSVILVKGARQMGKTSLTARGLQHARKNGARVVLTDFQKLNAAHLQSVDSLFLCLAEAIAEQLNLDVSPEQSWNSRRGPSMNFERFLRREILAKINERLVWGMDEVDRLFPCSFGSEVFGLFRSWHNERSLDPSGPWQRLSLAIAYASEAHLFITDVNQSPFNVGTRIILADFTIDQVRELNQRYGNLLRTESDLGRFYELVGGQPFLTQRGLHNMVEQGLSFNQFVAGAARDDGPYGDHLRRIFVSLNQDADLCDAVRDVIAGRHSSNTDFFYRLRSSGVVAGDSVRDMRFRCQLYEQYLSRYLN